jgi:polysaccharide biosynthesis transport protein
MIQSPEPSVFRGFEMTTLPQSTSPKMPQATALPLSPAGLGSTLHINAAPQMTPADMWRVIRANLWLVILLGIAGAGAGYGIYYYLAGHYPRYTANGYLQIQPPPNLDPINTRGGEESESNLGILTEQRTQATLLTQESIFSLLLKSTDPDIRATAWFRQYGSDPRKAKEYLRENLSASPILESRLMRVSFTYSVPADCKTILDQVVKIHLDQQGQVASRLFDVRINVLDDIRKTLDSQRQTLEAQIRNMRGQLIQQGLGAGGLFSTKERELDGLTAAKLRLENEASEATNQLDRVSGLIERGEQLPEVERAIEGDYSISQMVQNYSNLKISRDLLEKRLGREHPDVKDLYYRIELTERELNGRRDELRVRYRNQVVETLKGQKTQATSNLKTTSERAEALRNDLSELGKSAQELKDREESLRNIQDQKTLVETRIRDIKSGNSSPKRIDWASGGQPERPDVPSFPNFTASLSIGIFIGIALALAIAFLREFFDDTVRSPRDVTRTEHVNVLGIIADESDDPQLSGAALAIFDAPQSLTAEQFRQVRTRLQHVAPFDSTRSIMISGPSPLDGKTTVAANLAASLALNGRKVLLVDANFRRPEIHRVFNIDNNRGFSDVLNGAPLADATVASRIPNLSILPSGPKPLNATELFESQLLSDFLTKTAAEFDHVIFDSAPLLVVSEATAMAAKVDGVITVVRAHMDSRGKLQRMREELRKVRAENLGVVLNAVRARGGGYYGRNIKTYYDYQ